MRRQENALPQKGNQYSMKSNNFSMKETWKTMEKIMKNHPRRNILVIFLPFGQYSKLRLARSFVILFLLSPLFPLFLPFVFHHFDDYWERMQESKGVSTEQLKETLNTCFFTKEKSNQKASFLYFIITIFDLFSGLILQHSSCAPSLNHFFLPPEPCEVPVQPPSQHCGGAARHCSAEKVHQNQDISPKPFSLH